MLKKSVLENKTDLDLYNMFLNGNKVAFDEIIKMYRNSLTTFIMKFVRNIEVAEDLTQDTFLYMLINKKEYDFRYSLKTYLFTIARCKAINYLKKQNRRIEFDKVYFYNLDKIEDFTNIEETILKMVFL